MNGRPPFSIGAKHLHAKASETYVEVAFRYPDEGDAVWDGWVPIEYRRAGVDARNEDEVKAVVAAAYDAMRPSLEPGWQAAQDEFWDAKNAEVTEKLFQALRDSQWHCVTQALPGNPNWARRFQDLKEMGYTLATDTNRWCEVCGGKTTHLLLLRVPRGGVSGYETWSPALRKRILRVLGNLDVYEGTTGNQHLLPDHKFPEIRWPPGGRERNPDDMSDDQIRTKFQLMSNQRNQQKREVCRNCAQTARRGTPFGIPFYYQGGPQWPDGAPTSGWDAEAGCVGCGWYDMNRWRTELVKRL